MLSSYVDLNGLHGSLRHNPMLSAEVLNVSIGAEADGRL